VGGGTGCWWPALIGGGWSSFAVAGGGWKRGGGKTFGGERESCGGNVLVADANGLLFGYLSHKYMHIFFIYLLHLNNWCLSQNLSHKKKKKQVSIKE
jgi:hypothetical protein